MPQTILVAEDNIQLSKALSLKLSKAGFKVIFADNGAIAEQVLEDHPIDLVILDLMMPEVSGLYVLKKMKQEKKWSKIPVIVLTALLNNQEEVEKALAKRDSYLVKSDVKLEQIVLLVKNKLAAI